MTAPLRIGFIPLVDAAALIVAVDKGFAAAEGLDVTLVREVSWSNVRDKLNIGLFDAAHLLAPVAIASSLGLGHVKVPIAAPFNLGLNGNAITVSPALHAAIMGEIDGDRFDPMATALALARVVAKRRKARRRAADLRHDVSVLDPQLSVAVLDGGRRRRSRRGRASGGAAAALHGGQPRQRSCRRVLRRRALEFRRGRSRHRPYPAFRLRHPGPRGGEGAGGQAGLVGEESGRAGRADPRAHVRAAEFIEQPENRAEAARILAQPERIGVDAEVIQRTLDGRLKISPDGTMRESSRYLLVGREGAARPDPVQAAWLYAQMVRWGQTSISPEALKTAMAVFRPDLYDAALGRAAKPADASERDRRIRRARLRCRTISPAIWRRSRSGAESLSRPVQRCWAVGPTG